MKVCTMDILVQVTFHSQSCGNTNHIITSLAITSLAITSLAITSLASSVPTEATQQHQQGNN